MKTRNSARKWIYSKYSMTHYNFTLIELLIVISMITTLLASKKPIFMENYGNGVF